METFIRYYYGQTRLRWWVFAITNGYQRLCGRFISESDAKIFASGLEEGADMERATRERRNGGHHRENDDAGRQRAVECVG